MMEEKINMPMHVAKKLGYKPLNQNQKIVLEWLKACKLMKGTPINKMYHLVLTRNHNILADDVTYAYDELSHTEQFQLLAEFAKWGLGEVEK